jgi:hypothetical protein
MAAITTGIVVRIPVTEPTFNTTFPTGTDPAPSIGGVYTKADGAIFRKDAAAPEAPLQPTPEPGPETVKAGAASGVYEAEIPRRPSPTNQGRRPVMAAIEESSDPEHGISVRVPLKRVRRRRDGSKTDLAKSTSGVYQYREKDFPSQVETVYRRGAAEPALPVRRRRPANTAPSKARPAR